MRPGGEPGNVAVGGCLLVVAATMGVLHVRTAGSLDPVHTVISDYVVVSWGYALLAACAVAMAAACLVLAAGLRPAGLARPARPVALLVGGAVAMVVAGAFPTNIPGTPVGMVAILHRAAGGVAFATLPPAGLLIANRAATSSAWAGSAVLLRRCSAAAVLISSAYLLIHVLIVIAGSPEFPYIGAAERVLCAAMMLVLFTTARATRKAIDGAHMTAETPAELPAPARSLAVVGGPA